MIEQIEKARMAGMKKKIVSVLLALIFTVASMAGCGGKQDTVASGSGSGTESGLEADEDTASGDGLGHIGNGEDITLKMLAVQEDQEILKKMADDFAHKYKEDVNITVELEACPQEDIKKKMLTNLELAPDIYTFSSSDLRFLAESGALQEISLNTDKIIEENGGIDSSVIQAATYNGKLFAYPSVYDNEQVLYYNQKYFSEDDVDSLGELIDLTSENGKIFSMDFTSGLYLWPFFGGAGFHLVLNNEKNQLARFQARGMVPTNRVVSNSDWLKEDLTARAVAEQGLFALADDIQSDCFWKPMASLGGFCIAGDSDETIQQAFLDDTVEEIIKPVKQDE